jgi:hypothetical protein
MNPDTYSFSGDAVTFLGFVGVVSALVIVVTVFRRFYNSPYNVRYVPPQEPAQKNSTDSDSTVL